MKKLFTKGRIALLVIFSVLIIDQIIKVWIKTHMYWHESIRVTDWFYIYFTENNGMAFGMEIFGKLFLTTFRIVAVALIGWYLYKIIKKGFKTGYVMWPIRTAVSGKQSTPGGATEIMEILGKEESIKRIHAAIEKLEK